MVKRIAIRSFKIAKFCHTGRCISRYIKSEKCFIEWTPEEPLRRCTTLPTSTLHRIASHWMMQKPFLRRQRLFERKIFEKIHFFDLQTAQGKMKEREREREIGK